MTTNPQTGSVVTVTIQRVTPFGLRVELSDGQPGVIRDRELSWSLRRSLEHHTARFHPGETLTTVIVGRTSDGRFELSLRLAQSDPWIDVRRRYKPGNLVKGVVTGIQAYGVFVELEPGLTGLLHMTRLADPANASIPDVFWPGDEVYVTIDAIDTDQRRINLAHSPAIAGRWPSVDSLEAQSPHQPAALRPSRPVASLDRLPLGLWVSQTSPRKLLVVEDYAAHLKALATWLRRAGQHVLTAGCAEDALALLIDEPLDLVLMDFGLPGMSGLDAVKEIRKCWPHIQCAIMTDWSRADEHMAELSVLVADGVKLLIKPLLPEDLLDVLQPPESAAPAVGPAPSTQPSGNWTPISPPFSGHGLRDLLNRLHQWTNAAKVVLFQLDPAQRQIAVIADSGSERLREVALVSLIHSPVRDAAEDDMLVQVEDIQSAETYVRNLAPLLNFQACLGVPVPGQLATKHALFVFYALAGAIDPAHTTMAQATALALGGLLERQDFQRHAIELQQLALLGNLTRALVHEINHQLSPISFVIGDLEDQCKRLEQHAYESVRELQADLQVSRDGLHDLSSAVRNLIGTARMFHQMTVKSADQIVKLDTAASEVVQLLRDQADRSRVILEVVPADQIIFTRTHATQIQQVLLNLTLNAIQQIALARPGRGGRVRIRLSQKTQGSATVVQIAVEDDGPGIHRRLWERIFDLGFTTRQLEGSGLGLYISRSLMEAIHGRIYVAESAILWGTTMIIELPLRL